MKRFDCLFIVLFLVLCSVAIADKRQPDPDGCFSCHGLPDLKYIDKEGQIRSASILKSDYYGSLHGSVPCKDCHRKITDYPHEQKEGLVDCGESCHVKEPSNGKAFTHKPIVKEFEESAHGKGLSKDFAAGNRNKEENDSSLPSCRRCHNNAPYIAPSQMDAFKTEFAHNDAECGTCHEGDAWRNQYSGHILRRYIGNHLNKNVSNGLCIECHGNIKKMAKVEQEDPQTNEKKPVSLEFIHSTQSYDKTLHGRLLADGNLHGASCVQCHAPTGLHHGIKRDEDVNASVNPAHLAQTCGQSGCHKDYSNSVANTGFLTSEMHSVATLGLGVEMHAADVLTLNWETFKALSIWYKLAGIFGALSLVFLIGNIGWSLFGDASKLNKNNNNSLLGAEKFQRIIIGSKPKKKESLIQKIKQFVMSIRKKRHHENENKHDGEAS
jgi:sulfite reductase (NADPH) flavoprotein alpha-component